MGMDRKIKKKKWPAKRIITYAAAGIFIVAVLYVFIFKMSKSTLNVRAERLTISTVARGPFQEYIPIQGNVRPILQHFLTADEGGRVEEIYVEAGTMVKKG
ncbi:MAG: efflux RND transporter periplasmic adaptor subunit, partial [Candidatus Aminicenantes bacterium]